jgi:putative membrane protein
MRRVSLAAGSLALAGVWLGPIPVLAREAFFAHMTMHIVVVAVAAPLLALGLAGGRLDPVLRAPRILAPIPASLVEGVVVWAWHTPVLHLAARHGAGGIVAEQASFLLSALFLWLAAFGGERAPAGDRRAAGVAGLLLTSMHMTLLGALLALAPRPLYAHASGWAGLSALDDQHLGGVVMLLGGGVSYLAGGLWLMAGLLRGAHVERQVGKCERA